MKKKLYVFSIIIVSLVITAFIVNKYKRNETISADYPFYESAKELVDSSDIIIIGKVIDSGKVRDLPINSSINEKESDKLKYTLSSISVSKVLKGSINIGDVIEIKQLGDYNGIQEESLKRIDGYLKKDAEHLFFLKSYKNSPYSALNPEQGIIEIIDGKLYSRSSLSLFGTKKSNSNLDEVISAIQNLLSATE